MVNATQKTQSLRARLVAARQGGGGVLDALERLVLLQARTGR